MKKSKKNKKDILIILPFLIILILSLSTKASPVLDRVTAKEGMKKITNLFYKYASKEEINRPVAYKTEDWLSHVTRFIKMEKGELPIMGRPGFESSRRGTLEVAGVTKQGEILQFLEKTRILSIPNPLSRRQDTSGIWYKVRMLNGVEGWIFVKPDNTRTAFASYFEKKVTMPQKQETKYQDNDKRMRTIALYLLIILVLVIIILKAVSNKRYPQSYTSGSSSSYTSSHSFGYSYDSSSSSSRQSACMSAETKEEEKDKSEWPFREKDMLIGKKNVIEKHEIFPDVKVGEVKKNWLGNTEVHKKTWYGTEKVGEVKRGFFGGPKSFDTKNGGSYKIKETFFGRKIIVDEDGNEIGEYKGD